MQASKEPKEYWEKTIEVLSAINIKNIKEKYLQYPPMNYIQDLIITIIKETGFLDGLLNEEMVKTRLTERPQQLEFLYRIIKALAYANNEDYSKEIDPKKILTYQYPEMTNLLIQKIAKSAIYKEKLQWKQAVSKVLEEEEEIKKLCN